MLNRRASHTGVVSMTFEFKRKNCTDIYCALIGAGLELNQNGHARMTELCQCTKSRNQSCGGETAVIELEIQTFPAR